MSDKLKKLAGMLDELNELVFGKDSRLALYYVEDWDDLREQDLNANVMTPEMFNALVTNIQKNAYLESLPLVANAKGREQKEIVSGHHRIRAARNAGIQGGLVLWYKDLTKDEIRAKQLAHNSISGTSDPEIVAEIFNSIQDLELQMEAFIDPSIVDSVPDPVSFPLVDIDPLADAKVVTIVFLPTQAENFDSAIDLLGPDTDEVYLAAVDAFEGFKTAVNRVRQDLNIHSVPTAVAHMAEIAISYLDELQNEAEEEE